MVMLRAEPGLSAARHEPSGRRSCRSHQRGEPFPSLGATSNERATAGRARVPPRAVVIRTRGAPCVATSSHGDAGTSASSLYGPRASRVAIESRSLAKTFIILFSIPVVLDVGRYRFNAFVGIVGHFLMFLYWFMLYPHQTNEFVPWIAWFELLIAVAEAILLPTVLKELLENPSLNGNT